MSIGNMSVTLADQFFPGVQVRIIDNKKGKGLFATKNFSDGDVIFEELPLVSCQFAWNKAYKYLACDQCIRPLETIEENVRRLAAKDDINIPYSNCCSTANNKVCCDRCQTVYCSDICRETAYQSYHRELCYNESDSTHPLVLLTEAWKQIHYPPETTNIMLLVRILAMIKQANDPRIMLEKFKQFCHRTVSEDSQLVHKLLGDKFIGQLEMMREMTGKAIYGPEVQEFLTSEGFNALVALVGTNGQGIGTSPMAEWVENVSKLPLAENEMNNINSVIDELYMRMHDESGRFLDSEGSGLYELQSVCNHSCVPNAEPSFPHGNHRMQLKALKNINAGDEISISYIDDCSLGRSRHSRQKELALNYLFTCACEKCTRQSEDPDVTSAEEMSEDDENYDMSD